MQGGQVGFGPSRNRHGFVDLRPELLAGGDDLLADPAEFGYTVLSAF